MTTMKSSSPVLERNTRSLPNIQPATSIPILPPASPLGLITVKPRVVSDRFRKNSQMTILPMVLRQTEPDTAAFHTQPAKAEISN